MSRSLLLSVFAALLLVASATRPYEPAPPEKTPPPPKCPDKCVEYDDKFCIQAEVTCQQKACVKFVRGDCNRYENKCLEYELVCTDKHCIHYDLKCKEYKTVCLWYDLDDYHNAKCKKEEKICAEYEQKCTAEECFNYTLQCKKEEEVCVSFDRKCAEERCLKQHTVCKKTANVCTKKDKYCPPAKPDHKPSPSYAADAHEGRK